MADAAYDAVNALPPVRALAKGVATWKSPGVYAEARVNEGQSEMRSEKSSLGSAPTGSLGTLAAGGSNFDGNPVVGPALACTAAAQRVTGRQQMWTESSKTSQEAVATNFSRSASAAMPGDNRRMAATAEEGTARKLGSRKCGECAKPIAETCVAHRLDHDTGE